MSTPSSTPPADDSPDGVPTPRRRPALSPSRASDFEQCPLLYRFRAIDRIPETPSRAQAVGSVVHAVLEALFALPAAERVPDRARGLAEPAWDRVRAGSADLAERFTADDRFLDDVRRLVTAYFDLEDPASFDAEACELRVEAELDDGVPLRGFVDRVDVDAAGGVQVVDYKTGRAPRASGEAKALFQMKFYAAVLRRTRGVTPAQLRLLYLADGRTLTYRPDEDELHDVEGTLSAIWAAILEAGRTGDFRPTPSRLCDWCDHKSRCPAFGGTPPPYPGWPGGAPEASSDSEETVE